MRNPFLGLAWHCWRLSRRWYLIVLAVALGAQFTIMNLSPPGMTELPNYREHLAPGSIVLISMLALFTTLVAVSLGGRTGFPLRFEFRLPVSTFLLAGVPMLVLCALCASLYVIPMLLCRLIYGLPMPLVAGAVLVSVVAAMLAAASWMTSGATARAVALIFAVSGITWIFTSMQPFRMRNGTRQGEPVFDPGMLAFSAAEYVLLTLILAALYLVTVRGVQLQRQGGRAGTGRDGASRSWRHPVLALLDRVSELSVPLPVPASSPWRAELWLECRRHAIPVLVFALIMALLIPLLPVLDSLLGTDFAKMLVSAAPLMLILTGIGGAVFNRRTGGGGYMNPFEGTRGLGTLQLAVIQLGTLGIALILGTVMIGISVWLSAGLFKNLGPLWSSLGGLLDAARGGTTAQAAGLALSLVVGLFSVLGFFFCVHSCSLFWGRRVMYGTLAFLVYAVIFARTALTNEDAGSFVAQNMWWLAAATLIITLLLIFRVAVLQLMSMRTAAIASVAWSIAVIGGVLMLQGLDLHLLTQPPELKALNSALLTLPLTLFLGTVWCYDRLRHR